MLQTWNAKMDFKETAMQEAKGLESSFNVRNPLYLFLLPWSSKTRAHLIHLVFASLSPEPLRQHQGSNPPGRGQAPSLRWKALLRRGGEALDEEVRPFPLPFLFRIDASRILTPSSVPSICSLAQAQQAFRVALCNNFDTVTALQTLSDLTGKANVYVQLKRPNLAPARTVAEWIGRMLRMFGLGEGESKEIGWGLKREEGEGADVSRFSSASGEKEKEKAVR